MGKGARIIRAAAACAGLSAVLQVLPERAFAQTPWQRLDPSPTHQRLNFVTAAGRLMAVGDSGTILVSDDGATWTQVTSGTSRNLNGCVWMGRLWVAVGDSGTILTSSDGEHWTSRNAGTDKDLASVFGSYGVTAAAGSGGALLASRDGSAWTAATTGQTADFTSVAWTGTRFVAAGDGPAVWTSTDGAQWKNANDTLHSPRNFRRLIWTGMRLAGVTDDSLVVSEDEGVVWQGRALDAPQNGIAWSGGQYVTVGEKGTAFAATGDGEPVAVATGTDLTLRSIDWTGAGFIAVGDSGIILTAGESVSLRPRAFGRLGARGDGPSLPAGYDPLGRILPARARKAEAFILSR